MPVVGMVLVSPLFAYTIIQFTAMTTEMHDTETFKLYSERERLFCTIMFQCMSHTDNL